MGVDQKAMDTCFTPQSLEAILDFLLNHSYNTAPQIQESLLDTQAGLSVAHLQAKRYSAKVLTLLFRDFLNATTSLETKISKPHAKTVYIKSLGLLQSYLPFYLRAVTLSPT